MMNSLYEEYAVIESEISALEAKKEQLRPLILKQMVDQKMENVDIGVGKFLIAKLKKWTYPKKVLDLEKELKAEISTLTDEIKSAQEKAKSTGEATCEESNSLRFTPTEL